MLYDDKRVCFPQGWFVLVQSKEKQRTTLSRKKYFWSQRKCNEWLSKFDFLQTIPSLNKDKHEKKKKNDEGKI